MILFNLRNDSSSIITFTEKTLKLIKTNDIPFMALTLKNTVNMHLHEMHCSPNKQSRHFKAEFVQCSFILYESSRVEQCSRHYTSRAALKPPQTNPLYKTYNSLLCH